MTQTLPANVTIVEVGPRDGLQNEATSVPAAGKIALIDTLSATGLRFIEVTAFVNPTRVPQLADAEEVCRSIARKPGVTYSALVPNITGYERATAGAGLTSIAVFLSASETHNQKNIGASVEESLARYKEVCARADSDGVDVRGYVSTAFGCPYEGHVPMERVVEVSRRLLDLGVRQVSLGDTTGMGNPRQVGETVSALNAYTPIETIALHLHDTRGTALANALAGLQAGVTTFDAAVGGFGGCPYAPGATGNVATDELVYMFHSMGIATGIDIEKLMKAAESLASAVGHEAASRFLKAERATAERVAREHG
ncbi:MAG: hydroxymethylglutaryl-CoA lyase [Actinomycetota bacterium]